MPHAQLCPKQHTCILTLQCQCQGWKTSACRNKPVRVQVPRIAVEATTFQGLLQYNASPGKTVFIVSNSKAAGKTGKILYTFGTGVPERSCAFRPFFESFMADLQRELRLRVT